MTKFGTKNVLVSYYWARLRTIVIFDISTLKFVYLQNFTKKPKIPKFGIKSPLVWYFWARIFKSGCHIWNQYPQICLFRKFDERAEMPKFGTINVLLKYFWAWLSKNFCHISNQHPQICLFVKFTEKARMPKFETKISYFGIFGLQFYFSDIWNQDTKVCLIAKFWEKTKMRKCIILLKNKKCLNLGPKMHYLGIFGLEFSKTIVIFEISTLIFVYLQSFTKNKNA